MCGHFPLVPVAFAAPVCYAISDCTSPYCLVEHCAASTSDVAWCGSVVGVLAWPFVSSELSELEDEATCSSEPTALAFAVLATMWPHRGMCLAASPGSVAQCGGGSIGDEVLAQRNCVVRPPHAFAPVFQCRDGLHGCITHAQFSFLLGAAPIRL